MAEFVRRLRVRSGTLVLDVGGVAQIWELAPVKPCVVFLNQPRAKSEIGDASVVVFADGASLPFRDRSFDVVFSNSVIEHLASDGERTKFAAEVARVGKSYWVQTPNRRFPVELHLWTPLIHWLPRTWQARVLKRFSVWKLVTRPTAERSEWYVRHYLDSAHLLTAPELRALFPGAAVWHERFLGWSKSLVAYRVEQNSLQ